MNNMVWNLGRNTNMSTDVKIPVALISDMKIVSDQNGMRFLLKMKNAQLNEATFITKLV